MKKQEIIKCPKCSTEFEKYNKWGDARKFCSRKCANSKKHSNETKEKISKMLKGKYTKTYKCVTCGKKYIGHNRYKKCSDCKRKVIYTRKNLTVDDLMKLSSRTVQKIIQRAGVGCSLCGWNEASCDIHHIIHKKDGGSHDIDNLIIICPNCHRSIHINGKDDKLLYEHSIKNKFSDWLKYYNMR